jgi:hypothetical protein
MPAPFTWNNIFGFFYSKKFYEDVFQWLLPHASFVQIGSLWGKSIAYIATRSKQTKKPLNIISIDYGIIEDPALLRRPQFKDMTETTGTLVDNLRKCGVLSLVTHIVEDSAKSAYLFADDSVEFVYIDALHTYEAVTRDIQAWMPKIKIGGILAGDDYGLPGEHRVKQAVDDVFGFECPMPDYKEYVWAVVKQQREGKVVFVPLHTLQPVLKVPYVTELTHANPNLE